MTRRCFGAALIAALTAVPGLAGVEVIDRILAVVDGVPITQSDLAAAVRLGLVGVQGGTDPTAAVLDRLIERRLMLAEVDRYAPPEPPPAEVNAKLAATRARGGSQFERVLAQTGLTIEQLRGQMRDDLRIEVYLQQRFGAMAPAEADLLQYYREHAAQFPGTTFDEAHDRVSAALVTERRAGTIGDWVVGLRRRANIHVLPR